MTNFDFDIKTRSEVWERLLRKLEDYSTEIDSLPVSPVLKRKEIRRFVTRYSFDNPLPPGEALDHVFNGLKKYTVHTPHPRYFGLFNPKPNFAGILADTISAAFNPQLAAWSHAPFAVEAENILIRELGKKFGYQESKVDGTFASGGAEANLTALLCALNNAFPEYANYGVRGIKKDPVIYVSAESHHSLVKAARAAGLGMRAVRVIEVNENLQMRTDVLKAQIEKDLAENRAPLMVTATMGTTGTGAIDNISGINKTVSEHNLWVHADAAYGGAVVLSQEYRRLIDGIGLADSITFDAHKWMSVPMSAGIFITRHPSILDKTFRVTADYMPKEAESLQITDPFTHSIQWSRRFTGLKIYLSLLIFGWDGFDELIRRQIESGRLLRKELKRADWVIFNESELPIICFGKKYYGNDPGAAIQLCKKILDSGNAWLSVYNIRGVNTLRACITNYDTTEKSIFSLVETLNRIEQTDGQKYG